MSFFIKHPENKDQSSVAVLGCGWLGLSLAEDFVKNNFFVNGSTTSETKLPLLSSLGINPFLINFNPTSDAIVSDFFNTNILIINIPPKLRHRDGNFYLNQIDEIIKYIQASPIRKIVFVSSSSIYPTNNLEAIEQEQETSDDSGNKILFDAETKIRSLSNIPYLILRCAGLTGPKRVLIKHFSGRKDIPGGSSPVNLIHREDVIGIIVQLIKNNIWNTTLNICAPKHPTKKEYYENLAIRYNVEKPQFSKESIAYKIININKLQSLINYSFIYPDPMLFEY